MAASDIAACFVVISSRDLSRHFMLTTAKLRTRLVILAGIVFLICCAVGPYVVFRPDYRDYWLPWQYEVRRFQPWNAYSLENCNYPPVVLYALAAADAVRALLGIPLKSALNIGVIKLPNIAALLLGAIALWQTFAPKRPRVAAALVIAWLLSLNLFVNAAMWGQWDVILAIFLLFALLDLRRGDYLRCGAWLGVAMATKVQAIFVLPVIGVFLLARLFSFRDWKPLLKTAAGAIVAVILVFTPMALAGRLGKSLEVYYESVGTFKFRTVDAWNVWSIANTVEGQFMGGVRKEIMPDTRPAFGLSHFTHRDVGLTLFATYASAILITVFRRRSVGDVLVAAPLMGVAMYMLATQMHERYIGPPAALMTLWLLLPTAYRIQFVYWSAIAATGQFIVLVRSNPFGMQFRPDTVEFAYISLFFSSCNVIMFGWLTYLYFKPSFDGRPLTMDADDRHAALLPSENAPA